MKFTGTNHYVATDELRLAVNAAITLQRPLLVRANPGQARRCWRKKWRARWTRR